MLICIRCSYAHSEHIGARSASGFGVRSEHRLDILNAKPIGKEHLNVFITERFIEETVYFWDSVKKFRSSH